VSVELASKIEAEGHGGSAMGYPLQNVDVGRHITSLISALIKNDTTSKLAIKSCGLAWRETG
jgi:hypothetical protein